MGPGHLVFSYTSRNHMALDPNPHTLRQVCSWWNTLVLQSPSFWSSIVIFAHYDRMEYSRLGGSKEHFVSKAHAKSIALALSRAGGVPMYLHVHGSGSSPLPPSKSVPLTSILATIAKHQLTGTHFHGLTVEAVLGKVSFPSLQSLIFRHLNEVMPPSTANMFPKLERLIFDYFNVEDGLPPFPWTQLTHVFIEAQLSISAVTAILGSCLNVRRAAFHLRSNPIDYAWARTPEFLAKHITLPFLQDLTFFPSSPFHRPFSTIA